MSKANIKNKLWLIWTLSLRNYSQRYKGSLLGYFWPFISMFVLLLLYSMVFSIVFKARWKQAGVDVQDVEIPFWLILLSGQILYALMCEILNQGPGLILSVPNYVKKIIFPLETLPVVSFLVALFNALICLAVLLAAAAFLGVHHREALLIPLVFIQMTFWCLGLGWLLSSLGVFFRDLQQVMPLLSQVLLFATPIFYPPQIVPEKYKFVIDFNPLAYMVDTMRGLLLWGRLPDWSIFGLWTLAAMVFAVFGYFIFKRLRPSFADIM